MTPLGKAASAMREAAIAYCDDRPGKPDIDIPEEFLASAAITAFLEAAAEDERLCRSIWREGRVNEISGERTECQRGKAAILALKEAVNAGWIHFTDESRRLATELFRAERRAGMCRIMENAGDD